jgi:hypothetical protein
LIECIKCIHIIVIQLKVKDLGVRSDALRTGRFRKGDISRGLISSELSFAMKTLTPFAATTE